jgi:NAD-dependent SIR2 family protein deacetylase
MFADCKRLKNLQKRRQRKTGRVTVTSVALETVSGHHNVEDCRITQCVRCRLKRPFELPSEIVHACLARQLVIFAGAGVSTESRGVYPVSFSEKVRKELRLPKNEGLSFSKLMSLYSSSPRSRKNLLQSIKERLDYARSFPELYNYATEFHRELSTIPFIYEIFTTNWDDFFERECDAIPIVTSQDFAVFADLRGRKVFKLHGSVNNYGSIVATAEDYRKCYRKLSREIIGNLLRTHLMTKTFLFVGYSFEDEDFQRICKLLSREVQGLIPRSFVVTLDEQADKRLKSVQLNMTPIITGATYFIQVLKRKLVREGHMLPDERYAGLDRAYANVMTEHSRLTSLSYRKHPDSLYSQSYQDGLQHAFGHIIATMKSGQNSDLHHMVHVINSYEILRKRCLSQGNYPDVAYFDGYQTGMMYFLADETGRRSLPLYYLFGAEDITSFSQYLRLEKNAPKLHKAAHKAAGKIAESVQSEDLILHRSPFL